MEIRRAAFIPFSVPDSSPWMIIDYVLDCITRGPACIIYYQGKVFYVRPHFPHRQISDRLKILLYDIAAVN